MDRGRAVEHLALRLGIGVAGGLHAVQGHTLKFPGGFFVGSRSRNVPADPSMRWAMKEGYDMVAKCPQPARAALRNINLSGIPGRPVPAQPQSTAAGG